jgi:hypothetical protein
MEEVGFEVVAVDVAHSVCQELDVKRLFALIGSRPIRSLNVFLVLSCAQDRSIA